MKEVSRVALEREDAFELSRCEEVIARGWKTFIEVGRALTTIRDRKLYREQAGTFEAYCRSKWDYGKSQVYHLIGAAEVVSHLSTIVDIPLPKHESRVRPLVGLEAEQARDAWLEAVRKSGIKPVTATAVRQSVATFRKKKRRSIRAGGGGQKKKPADTLLDMLEEGIREQQPATLLLKLVADLRRSRF